MLAVLIVTAGLIPHLAYAASRTGSVLGILRESGRVAGRDYLGQGLVHVPVLVAVWGGPIVFVLTLLGLGHWVGLIRRHEHAQDRPAAFLGTAAVIHLLVTGLLVHGEFRYYFFSVALLVLLGARAMVGVVERHSRAGAIARVGVAALALGVLVAAISATLVTRHLRRMRAEMAQAGAVIRRAAGGHRCEIEAHYAHYVPELSWYSRCSSARLRRDAGPTSRYLVVFAREPGAAVHTPRGPHARLLERIPDRGGRLGAAAVYLLPPR